MSINQQAASATGGCLCGAVTYEVYSSLRSVINCHCIQCRRTSGHYVAATAAPRDALVMTEKRGLRWYHSSSDARRGFCQFCGSSLFWEPITDNHDDGTISIMAGTLDSPTGLTSTQHIFTDFAGDYYSLDDRIPQKTSEDYQ